MLKGIHNLCYLESQLNNGIRAKEFYEVGNLTSDATPLDTDFSEITVDNLADDIGQIINSTYSSSFGPVYYIVKKDDYDKEKSYAAGNGSSSTRYIRTGIGSTSISYIISPTWDKENSYMMARSGIFIPVIDGNGKELFAFNEFTKIREKMRGLSFYDADDFIIDDDALNKTVLKQAEEMKKEAENKTSTEEKREKITDIVKKELPVIVVPDMMGDLSDDYVELIDIGSTGRGTNIPGDGDFDFMLKCSSKDEQVKMITILKDALKGRDKGGTSTWNIRYIDVEINGLEEPVEVDVTSEKKKLQTEYSSDLCIRDRLDNIRKKYGEEKCNHVIDNIIVAKKQLKKLGAYKKTNSNGETEKGGFGGIGIETWVLQNGGSFIQAMETFLDATKDANGEEVSFKVFKTRYPIYDFGQNHRGNVGANVHDDYIEGLTPLGFDELKKAFVEILKEYGIEYEYSADRKIESIDEISEEELFEQIKEDTKNINTHKITDKSKIYEYLAEYHAYKQQSQKQDEILETREGDEIE